MITLEGVVTHFDTTLMKDGSVARVEIKAPNVKPAPMFDGYPYDLTIHITTADQSLWPELQLGESVSVTID